MCIVNANEISLQVTMRDLPPDGVQRSFLYRGEIVECGEMGNSLDTGLTQQEQIFSAQDFTK